MSEIRAPYYTTIIPRNAVEILLPCSGEFTFWAAIESLRALIATETTEFDAFISDFSKFSEFSGSKN